MTEQEAETLQHILASSPSDAVMLDEKANGKLYAMWSHNIKGSFIPADLIHAGTLPLYDFMIMIEGEDGIPARVVFSKDIIEALAGTEIGKDEIYMAGAVVLGGKAILPAGVSRDAVAILGEALNEASAKLSLSADFINEKACAVLTSWYGIQIALLHPQMKKVFRNGKAEPLKQGKSRPGQRKRPVRYVKKHIITASSLGEAIASSSKSFERKTLAWYVIGHWRHMSKTGKDIFVPGYWKGPLREMKAAPEVRRREIEQDGMG